MAYPVIILFVVAVLNAFFGYFIVRGKATAVNTLFALVALSVSFWSLGISFFIQAETIDAAKMFADMYYLAAAVIPLLFLYFTLIFPYDTPFKKSYYWFLAPFLLLATAIVVDKDFILSEVFFVDGIHKDVVINNFNYTLYAAYFVFFVILSYIILLRAYFNLPPERAQKKRQLIYIIWGTAVSYVLGMAFNLFLPWVGNYQFIWLGPPFSAFMVSTLGFAIIKHHLFNVRVIATEALTFALWFFVLIRTIIADTLQDQIVNASLLVILVGTGILLIRSVSKEVEARERIEGLAADLQRANSRLRELDEQKSEFVSIASHQLRSPLTAIKGYGSMLLEGSFGRVPKKLQEPVEKIYHSSQLLVNLVEDLLNVTRIEQGRMQYEKEALDVAPMVKEILEEVRPNILHPEKVSVEFNYDKREEYTINADEAKIRQVFLNLIDNAIKYTPEGTITVSLEKPDKGHILFSVADEGIGFSEDFKQRDMFGKFNRAQNGQELHASGSGIGLYVAKEITEAHRGSIWAESEGEGKGATFYVELPAA